MGKIVDGVYYGSDGKPAHRGTVALGGKIYYAGKDGVLVKDKKKTIHHGMANGLVGHGTYYFDSEGVIDLSSFVESEGHSESAEMEKQEPAKKEQETSKKKSISKTKHKHRRSGELKRDMVVLIIVACLALAAMIIAAIVSKTDKIPKNYSASEKHVAANGAPVEIAEQEIERINIKMLNA